MPRTGHAPEALLRALAHILGLSLGLCAAGAFQSLWQVSRYQSLITDQSVLARLAAAGFVLGSVGMLITSPLLGVAALFPTVRKRGAQATTSLSLALAAVLSWLTCAPTLLSMVPWTGVQLLIQVAGAIVLARSVARRVPSVWVVRVGGALTVPLVVVSLVFGPPKSPPTSTMATAPAAGPDVLLVTVDTLRADHIGEHTPAIRQLASEGVQYRRALASSPWTLPSMASMLTGHTSLTHQAGRPLSAISPNVRTPLLADMPVLAEDFAAAGYRTGAIVSNVFLSADYGIARGFQTYENPLFTRAMAGNFKENVVARAMLRMMPPTMFGDPRAEAMVDTALSWWSDPTSQAPRFLWLHLVDPHAPWKADPAKLELQSLLEELGGHPEPNPDGTLIGEQFGAVHEVRSGKAWLQPWDRARLKDMYRGQVGYTDTALGRLFDAMRSQERPVIVVFTADHGEEFWDHGGFEHGHDFYTELTRVPMIFWGHGVAEGGNVDEPVGLIDVAPTLLSLAGLPPRDVEGVALAGVRGEEEKDLPPRFSENNLYDLPAVLVEDGPWRLIHRSNGHIELYDAAVDPREMDDVSLQHPEVVQRLSALTEPRLNAFDGTIQPMQSGGPSLETTEALRSLGYME